MRGNVTAAVYSASGIYFYSIYLNWAIQPNARLHSPTMTKYWKAPVLLASLALWGCSETPSKTESEKNEVVISGNIQNLGKGIASLHYTEGPAQAYVLLDSMTPNAEGDFTLRFEMPKASVASFSYGRESSTLYLHPGDSLHLTLDTKMFDESISYSGENAKYNNFLAQKYLLEERMNAGTPPYKMELDSMMAHYNAQNDSLNALQQEVLGKQIASEAFAQYWEAEKKFAPLLAKLRYPMMYNYYNKAKIEVPEDYYSMLEGINWNDEGNLANPTFTDVLDTYINNSIKDELSESITTNEYLQIRYQWIEKNLTGKVQSFILAKAAIESINIEGIGGESDWYGMYKASHAGSSYLDDVTAVYNKWKPLAKGLPAPEFKYLNPEGEEVALSDFAGKVVYVDLWATWCRPCRAEFPYAKKLKEKFKDESDLVFLYISIDDNKEAWEKMLEEDKEFASSVHVHAEGAWKSTVAKDYLVNSIPRYLMIDRNGNIANANAPRPSSKKTEDVLKELLAKNTEA